MKYVIMLVATVFLFTGCSVSQLGTAQSSTYAKVKDYSNNAVGNRLLKEVYVLDFKRDVVDFSDTLFIEMNQKYVNSKKYFNVSRRDDLALIYSYSKAMDFSQSKDILNEKYVLTGRVIEADFTTNNTIEEVANANECLRYDNYTNKCVLYSTYNNQCMLYTYALIIEVELGDLEQSKSLFSKVYTKNNQFKACQPLENQGYLKEPSLSEQLKALSLEIAKDVVNDFMPFSKVLKINFIKKNDIYYSQEELNLLKSALNLYVETPQGALDMFELLVKKTNEQSSVALYNLALANEAFEKSDEALVFYKKALAVASLQNSSKEFLSFITEGILRCERKLTNKEYGL